MSKDYEEKIKFEIKIKACNKNTFSLFHKNTKINPCKIIMSIYHISFIEQRLHDSEMILERSIRSWFVVAFYLNCNINKYQMSIRVFLNLRIKIYQDNKHTKYILFS